MLCSPSLRGAEEWSRLKLGMTTDDASEVLGPPLLKTSGHGFELWIYDHNAEALFYGGPLVGWRTPSKPDLVGRTVDVWQNKSGNVDLPFFILPRSPFVRKRLEKARDDALESRAAAAIYSVRN